ncbi:MAG: PAS domain-containing protein [Planctomycetes bacterium]|nr:PAS domain-containing protein [Planctomycetota bacterium]
MPTKRLLWQLYVTYLLVILVCTLAVGGNALGWFDRLYFPLKQRELLDKARLVEGQVLAALVTAMDTASQRASVDPLCKKWGRDTTTRVTVVLPDGTVVGDSQEDPAQMDDHSRRPELRAALAGQVGYEQRDSPTLGIKMMYVAVPLKVDGRPVGALRTSLALTEINETMHYVGLRILLGVIIVVVLTSVLALLISRRLAKPLTEMRQGADRFAQGDFNRKLPVSDTEEIGGLAAALNTMARQLDRRIKTITRQQQELAAVLSSMTEGVLAIDGRGHIISVNQAAAAILAIDVAEVPGRGLAEVIRNPELQDFVALVRERRQETEQELGLLRDGGELRLQLHGSTIRDEAGRDLGVLVVLRDVTRLRRLERMRSDFVANVSHELKTPITSIQGFVETLDEGAVDDNEKARHFLSIIARQVERLNAIIDDLLSLSAIEQDAERGRVVMKATRLADPIQAAVATCRDKADEKRIRIEVSCPDNIEAGINSHLFEQAVRNLLDNAIKYSEADGEIRVQVERNDEEIRLSVEDRGCGIPQEHLSRIFERFYCVDKARSRKLGGTGLGLAIVKHIIQAHGGRVTVHSVPRKGSTFTLHLPLACGGATVGQ